MPYDIPKLILTDSYTLETLQAWMCEEKLKEAIHVRTQGSTEPCLLRKSGGASWTQDQIVLPGAQVAWPIW